MVRRNRLEIVGVALASVLVGAIVWNLVLPVKTTHFSRHLISPPGER